MSSPRSLIVVVACATGLAGCGLQDPNGASTSTHGATPAATASTATTATTPTTAPTATTVAAGSRAIQPPEHDGPREPRAPQLPASATGPTPQATLARFARLYINWSADQLPRRADQLAGLSIGQARAEAMQLGSRAAALERYQVTNSGTVVAVATGQADEHGRWVVVTNELTSGSGPYLGLPATSHVTWATVERQRNGYVVSGWLPAS
jgi:hypothetical protein